MNAFEYVSPVTKEQAVPLLSSKWGEAEILAGGTDLLSFLKDNLSIPKRIVNIKGIQEFQGIHTSGGGLRLGALVTLEELLKSAPVQNNYPALIQAVSYIESPQIRNFGTVGGDLCQRPRCWYFRSNLGYFPQNNGKDSIPQGENQFHAILGNQGPAYFVNPSSLAPALIALQAKARLFGPKGWREVALDQFFTTPQNEGEREYVMKPDEVLGEILLPSASGFVNASYEVRQKQALDWPLAAAAAALRLRGKAVEQARLVLGHVAPIPWRAREAESSLQGKIVNEATAAEAAHLALKEARPLSKNGYKVQLAEVALKRAILKAAEGGIQA
jgi:xanthine dehydrogenase YagS FAD-binding subunit